MKRRAVRSGPPATGTTTLGLARDGRTGTTPLHVDTIEGAHGWSSRDVRNAMDADDTIAREQAAELLTLWRPVAIDAMHGPRCLRTASIDAIVQAPCLSVHVVWSETDMRRARVAARGYPEWNVVYRRARTAGPFRNAVVSNTAQAWIADTIAEVRDRIATVRWTADAPENVLAPRSSIP